MFFSRPFSFAILFLVLCCFAFNTQAQPETANWHFGKYASLKFSQNGAPSSHLGSAMNTPIACSSISDSIGNLLFYTNGDTIWNRQNQIMNNGIIATIKKQHGPTCIIIPKPGNLTRYYILTLSPYTSGPMPGSLNSITYSEVEMTSANGLGEVIPTTKNSVLYTVPAYWMSGKITAVRHANNRDVWLVAHRFSDYYTHNFIVYKITAAGPSASPVISILPTINQNFDARGNLKASPQGDKIGFTSGFANQLFNFDNRTGILSNLTTLSQPLNNGTGGLEFSQDGKKLYVSTDNRVEQYNLNLPSPAAIVSSKMVISPPNLGVGTLQLTVNGKIYGTNSDGTYLSEIANPNVAGLGCKFQAGPQLVAPTISQKGLPGFINSFLAAPRFEFAQACAGNTVNFTIPDQSNVDSVKWHFGDADPASNTSHSRQPGHVFANPGSYTVALTLYMQGEAPVYRRQVAVLPWPRVSLGLDTAICEGQALTLRNRATGKAPGLRYAWNSGDTTSTLNITQPGTYRLTVSNGICQTQDSITVRFKNCRPAYIPNILTLNGDHKNETFAPRDLEEGTWKLQIFNRWGTRVYQTDNYLSGWPSGNIAAGTYYYLLENAEANRKYKGWLEVVK